jgi:putative DNA primase/helicase
MECEYRRARLAGARLNCVSELPEADILVSGPVKAMISGDLISARHIRESPFDFRPTVAHLFSANMLPGVRDMSVGFWRRWVVLEFNRSFAPHEQDRGLAERVVSTELAEIASWAVAGAAQLAARGHYADPDSSVISLASWRKQADQLSAFIGAACEKAESDDEYTAAASLYHEYVSWATLNGHHRLSSTKFGKRLKALGVGKTRKSSGVFYALSVSG